MYPFSLSPQKTSRAELTITAGPSLLLCPQRGSLLSDPRDVPLRVQRASVPRERRTLKTVTSERVTSLEFLKSLNRENKSILGTLNVP